MASREVVKKRNEEIIKLAKEGMMQEDICKKFKLSDTTVRMACERKGVKVLTPGAKLKQRNKEIAEYVAKGHTTPEAMEHFGVTANLVSQACSSRGVKPSKFDAKRNAEIAKAISEGGIVEDVAKKFQLKAESIKRICASQGISCVGATKNSRSLGGTSYKIIAALQLTTKTQSKIARELNISRQLVNHIGKQMKRNGVPLHKDRK